MRGGKFYIFGGQQDVPLGAPDEDAFLNDLWCFDLQNRRSRIDLGYKPSLTVSAQSKLESLTGPKSSMPKVLLFHPNELAIRWSTMETAFTCECATIVSPKRRSDFAYSFGGTDGQYHYNDTWCFNTSTCVWSELSCIGYIPVPREGHASTLVDDVVYVFGGRSVDGKDLEDLAAFKISSMCHTLVH